MNSSNLKDTLSTIAGVLFAVCTGIVTASASGVTLPSGLVAAAGTLAAISGAVIGFLTGKAPNATSKTPEQVADGNAPK